LEKLEGDRVTEALLVYPVIKVLIQAEAGSPEKMRYDEKTLKPIKVGRVSRPYPYPYGFVVATTAADGDNVDCYVFGDDGLKSGSIVDCEVVGLLDQIESGEADHKVLAVVAGHKAVLPDGVFEVLEDFIYGVFSEYPDCAVSVGPIHSRDAAVRYVRECRDS
jgi:inorganic pyrophosphatase